MPCALYLIKQIKDKFYEMCPIPLEGKSNGLHQLSFNTMLNLGESWSPKLDHKVKDSKYFTLCCFYFVLSGLFSFINFRWLNHILKNLGISCVPNYLSSPKLNLFPSSPIYYFFCIPGPVKNYSHSIQQLNPKLESRPQSFSTLIIYT